MTEEIELAIRDSVMSKILDVVIDKYNLDVEKEVFLDTDGSPTAVIEGEPVELNKFREVLDEVRGDVNSAFNHTRDELEEKDLYMSLDGLTAYPGRL